MNNYAYITLLSNDDYVPGVILLKATLDSVGTKYPLVVLLPNKLSDTSMSVLKAIGVETRQIDKIYMPEHLYEYNKKINARQAEIWKDTLSKFVAWTFEEYDKIILIDCDILVLKNLDDLFEKSHMTAALDGEYFNLWPTFPHFNTGLVVIKPNKDDFKSFLKFANEIEPSSYKDGDGLPYTLADQELLNIYYKDWVNKPELHLNKYYNIFAPHMFKEHFDDVINNAYLIHFTGIKPWQIMEDNHDLSPLRITELSKYRDYRAYAYAAAIISTVVRSFSDNSNIVFGLDNVETKYYMTDLLIHRFLDLDAALEIGETIPEYVNVQMIKDIKKADENKDRALELLASYYAKNATSGIPSLKVYTLMASIERQPIFEMYTYILDIINQAEKASVSILNMN